MTGAPLQTPSLRRPAAVAPGMRRRRSVPRMLGGALMALVGMAVFGVVALRATPEADVLILARPVAAGMKITDADLDTVAMVAGQSMTVFPAQDRARVVGRAAALPLAAGTLLTPAMLADAAQWPPAGRSVIAVGVKTGRAPAGLAAGTAVLLIVVPANSATPDQLPQTQAAGTVIAVDTPDTSGLTVVTVELASDAAVQIAAAVGEVAVVVQGR